VGRQWLESLAGIRCNVEIASEYRYRTSVADPRALVVVISQSGETADTLSALKHAQSLGPAASLAICNVATSALMRMTELQFLTRAGAEIGVASTKAFTTQLSALFVLALTLAKLRDRLSVQEEGTQLQALRHLPTALGAVLAVEPQVIAWAERFARKEHALYLGRGLHYPIALEGALKLKEISYIHAEAYPAGELKHGPLALVTGAMPVVTVAPNDALLEKLKSNMQEVRARGGELYVFADADTRIGSSAGVNVIRLPEHYGALSPILHVVPLQLLAYVAYRPHAIGALGRAAAEAPRFLFGNEEAGFCICRHAPLVGEEAPRLPPVKCRSRPAAPQGVVSPLRRIHVDEIDAGPDLGQIERVLRHRRGVDECLSHVVATHGLRRPLGKPAAPKIRQAERLAIQKSGDAARLLRPRRDRFDVQLGAQRLQRRHVLPVRRIIDESAEKHAVAAGEVPQKVIGAHLVALVGRVREPMREKEQRFHQPRLLTRCGPMRFATEMGRWRQSAMSARYFGLSGLFSGMLERR
jgi:fructoselysine-6-P-deglycase FrlB-like protein